VTPLAKLLEAALFASATPVPADALRLMAAHAEDGETTLESALEELRLHYEDDGHGVELVEVAGGWQILTRPEYTEAIERAQLAARPQRLSAAALETLAIIAYRQPVTRGDIEDIRGVTVSGPIIKQLEDRGWIEAIGTREAPGRPALYATTRHFLDDLGLARLDQLPVLQGPPGAEPAADLLAHLGDGQGALELDAEPPLHMAGGHGDLAETTTPTGSSDDVTSQSESTPQP